MKKKVLHVSAGGINRGGVGSVIFSIVDSLHTQFDFDCVVFNRKSDQEEDFKKYGKLHRIHCYPRYGKRDYIELVTRPFKLYFGIRKICKTKSFDAIHCHNQRDEWVCLMAAKHAGIPVRIAHSHVTNSPKKRSKLEKMYKSLSPFMLQRYANVNVGCSKLACEQFYNHDRYIVIPNSIDLTAYSQEFRKLHESMQFIHVGRFTYAKNQEFVLETFAKICNAYPEARLFLVGYGEPFAVEQLEKQIEMLGIRENVELVPGDTADIPDYYARSDYMIFPSRFEGFGIVLVEAQAMGIQCYVSENIQQEADVGLVTFLNLSDGPEKWARCIISDIRNGIHKTLDIEKLNQYSNESICKQYAAVYNGELTLQK